MSQASQEIARQYANAAVNKKNWGALAYNVLSEGLSGDGVTNDTANLQALINKAIAEGRKTLLFPHGSYYVTSLTNADKVDFVGDNSKFVGGYSGTIGDMGGFAAFKAETAKKTEIERIDSELAGTAKRTEVNALATTKADLTYVDNKVAQIASGSPKGTYVDLTALQTAFPNGNAGNYVLQSDGIIYNWNGTAWVSTGILYQSKGIADKSIDDKQLIQLYLTAKRSNNIYNGIYHQGHIVQQSTGNLIIPSVDPDTYFATDFIDVYGLANIITSTKDVTYFAFYDANKVFISGGDTNSNKFAPLTVPVGSYFARLATTITHLSNYMVNAGTVLLSYEPYRVVDTDLIKKDSISEEKLAPISPKKTTFFKQTVNLFNKNETVNGFYVGSGDGLKKANASYCYFEIEVEPNTSYSRSYIDQVAFFTINKIYISGLNTVTGQTTFITPTNARYVVVSLPIDRKDSYQLQKGGAVTAYEEFGYSLSKEYLPNDIVGTKSLRSIISPMVKRPVQVKLLGDSITHGVGGTGFAENGELIPTSGWHRTFNVNTSGTCWANSLKGYFLEKFNSVVKNWGCTGVTSKFIKDNLSTSIEESDNIVIIMIGTNDRNNSNNITKTQLYDNLIAIGNYVRGLGKEVIFMSSIPASIANETDSTNIKNYHMEDVDTVVMSVSEHFKQDYISIYKEFMNYCDLKNITIDSLLKDELHPNDQGYTVMFNIICDKLGIGRKRVGATW